MTNYNWIISAMECRVKEGDLNDVVILVHWRYNATSVVEEKEYFADTYGATSMPLPTGEEFTAYEDLTKEQVCGWLENTLDIEAMQINLNNQIDLLINPINVTLQPPFGN